MAKSGPVEMAISAQGELGEATPKIMHRRRMGVPFVGHEHRVQFYENDAFLCESVANFLAEGLSADQPAVVIARAAHRDGIRGHLQTRVPDFESKCHQGQIVFLDADETLKEFMRGDLPDADAFARTIGVVLQKALL